MQSYQLPTNPNTLPLPIVIYNYPIWVFITSGVYYIKFQLLQRQVQACQECDQDKLMWVWAEKLEYSN